jgi:transposase-like protein
MRTRETLSSLIEGRLSSPDGRSELVKLATRLILEEALEAETRDALGRDYYERGAEDGRGWRNGHRTGRLKTAEGAIEFSAPQVAGRDEPFRSAIRDHAKGRTEALEDLAVEMLARGLSVRDIEDAFRADDGRLLLSRTAVSELGEQLWRDYQDFAMRDLSEHEIVYLFVDGIAERIRPGQRREPVMAAPSRSPDRDPFRDGSRGLLARDGASRRPGRVCCCTCLQGRLALSPPEIG